MIIVDDIIKCIYYKMTSLKNNTLPSDLLGAGNLDLETSWVTFQRYKNEDLPQMPPKGIMYSKFPGALECQKARAFPDGYSTYIVTKFTLQAGWVLKLEGRFPHNRYLSFTIANILDDDLGNGDFITGDKIEPDHGSVNPYREGVNRNISNRNYTVYIKQANKPEPPEPNTIYVQDNLIGKELHFPQRNYLPDIGYDGVGVLPLNISGSGLPIFTLILPDGREVVGLELIQMIKAQKDKIDPAFPFGPWSSFINTSSDPLNAPATPNPKPEIFRSSKYSILGRFFANEPARRIALFSDVLSGGMLNNPNTRYLSLMYSLSFGEVLVIRGKKPSHPKTHGGNNYYDTNTQVKYFSVTIGGSPVSGVGYQTIFDEQMPVDTQGYYTIAVSKSLRRPSNATLDKGVCWLNADYGEGDYIGARGHCGIVYTRFQGPASGDIWPESPLAVPNPSYQDPVLHEEEIMGEYYQQCTYMTKKQFESSF